VQRVYRMGGSSILAHAAHRIASLLKASPEGEGVHPSQNVTLNLVPIPLTSPLPFAL
jgi:hypothetical protein